MHPQSRLLTTLANVVDREVLDLRSLDKEEENEEVMVVVELGHEEAVAVVVVEVQEPELVWAELFENERNLALVRVSKVNQGGSPMLESKV